MASNKDSAEHIGDTCHHVQRLHGCRLCDPKRLDKRHDLVPSEEQKADPELTRSGPAPASPPSSGKHPNASSPSASDSANPSDHTWEPSQPRPVKRSRPPAYLTFSGQGEAQNAPEPSPKQLEAENLVSMEQTMNAVHIHNVAGGVRAQAAAAAQLAAERAAPAAQPKTPPQPAASPAKLTAENLATLPQKGRLRGHTGPDGEFIPELS